MSTRRTTVVSWRSLGLAALVALLVLPFTLLIGAPNRQAAGTSTGQGNEIEIGGPGARDGRAPWAAQAELRVTDNLRRQYYKRPSTDSWWPAAGAKGLQRYGSVSSRELRDRDVVIFPNSKGSLKIGRPSDRDTLPTELSLPVAANGNGNGKGRYYIAQLTPAYSAGKSVFDAHAILKQKGMEPLDYIPNSAFLVRINDPKNVENLKDTKVFQYSTLFMPADRVHPAVGRKSLRDEARAASDTLHLHAKLMPGADREAVEQEITRHGGEIVKTYDFYGRESISFTIRNNRFPALVRRAEDVYSYNESLEFQQSNYVTSQMVEIGRLFDPRDSGRALFPFRAAGINGGGFISSGLPNYSDPNPGAALSLAGAVYAVQPQFLGVADNGLTLDTHSFANDNTHPCLTGACTTGGAPGGLLGLGPNHRKVEAYLRGGDFDATSTGDFLTCDSIRQSGGNSHGTLVAGGAAANPSDGQTGLGRRYNDIGTIDQFVTFFNDTREDDLSLDGQAGGARVIFQDIANTPVSSPPACAVVYLSDVDAGDEPADRVADMIFRRDLVPLSTTLHARGAKVTVFAFGAPVNFDDNLTNGQGTYTNGADTLDTLLFNNREVLHVTAVGNDGADPSNNADIDPFDPTDPNDVFDANDIQVNDIATGKNVVTVGSNTSDRVQATQDPGESIANFTSKGPATFDSLRGAPLVVAPGVDIGNGFEGREGRFSNDYFISLAQTTSFDNENDMDSAPKQVENVLIQGQAGTSMSAGKIAGAALQVRDYFAQGFYPSGSATAAERMDRISGPLVKALLINSTDFASLGPLLASCTGRGPLTCVTEEGYGKVELANTLPLANYREERRPPNTTNVAPSTNIPQSLLVADEYFDGGMRGDGDTTGSPGTDGSTTGIAVVPRGGSVSFDVFRRHGNDQFRISLAWYDAAGDTLRNDLNLQVLDGDYDLRAGGICSTVASFLCGECTAIDNFGAADAGYLNADALNPYIYIYNGNQFRDFAGQFSLHNQCDPGTGVILDPIANDLPENGFDTLNTTESVMLHYFGAPEIGLNSRSGGHHGRYRIRVSFPTAVSNVPAPNSPCIAPGPNGTLDSVQVGDDTLQPFRLATGVASNVRGSGADGVCNSATTGDDVELVAVGNSGQPFGLAVAGPVGRNHPNSIITLNRDYYDCSDTLSLKVVDNSRCTSGTCDTRQATPATSVRDNTKVQVWNPNGTPENTADDILFDQESNFTMTSLATTLGASTTRVSRHVIYQSNSRRVQNTTIAGATARWNNGLVEVRDGFYIRGVYDDKTRATGAVGATPEPIDSITTAQVNCRPFIGKVLIGGGALPVRGNAFENARRTMITGGCDVGRQAGGRGDFSLDAGETLVYQVGFSNQSQAVPVNLKATLSCVDPGLGTVLNPCNSITILQPNAELGLMPSGREGIASFTLRVEDSAKLLLGADGSVDLKVCFQARSTDFAQVLESAGQCFTSREAVQADMRIRRYNTDLPGGGTLARDFNRDGEIFVNPEGSQARNLELATYLPLTGTSNNAIAANMPWRLDTNQGGFTAFRTADSKPGLAQNSLAWFYSTAGGCGWQTQNNGVVSSSSTAPKGVWHAGHGPVLGFGVANSCPAYQTPGDTLTADFVEYIHDVLWSPEFNKVNPGLSSRGIPFDLRMESVGWNEEQDLADITAVTNLELDNNLDLDDGRPINLGDSYSYRVLFGSNGPRLGAGDGARTFGPFRDSDGSIATKGIANGDEVGVSGTPSVGGQRVETNFLERPLMAFPVADQDSTLRGFQGNTAIDSPGSGITGCTGSSSLPCILGVCQGGFCVSGGDALIGTACAVNGTCTGPGTRIGHTTAWGPVRNRELDGAIAGTYEDFRGPSGTKFQFEFGFFLAEGGDGANGWTIDDPYFEWSEQTMEDPDPNDIDDCDRIGGVCSTGICTKGKIGSSCTVNADCVRRAGTNADARQCGTVSFERMYLHNCNTGMKIVLTDTSTASVVGTQGCAAGQVPVNVRSDEEPFGETFCLAPQGGGQFEGTAQISGVSNQPGILFVNSTAGENFNITASYRDPECDQDSDGQLNESDFTDVDGDGVKNFGADNVRDDISASVKFAEGQGSSDDDNCFDQLTGVDTTNPVGSPAIDVNGGGTTSSEDCPTGPTFFPADAGNPSLDDATHDPTGVCSAVPGPGTCSAGPVNKLGAACVRHVDCENHGRSLRNGQCDWDNDGHGDICDNCPTKPNINQLDTDGDGIGNVCEDTDIDKDTIDNSIDNCPTLYNPSQAVDTAGDPRGHYCNFGLDVDSDLVLETNDNCPNFTGNLENGVPRPAFTATYNPAQEDVDADGIGDKCDSEDGDNDGVINLADNCPTVYNPADPVFQFQTDSDGDTLGDDRTGRDVVPCSVGPACPVLNRQNYCDPDSTDDNNSTVPDDLINFLAELDCNFTALGIGRVGSSPSVVGAFAIQGISVTDDGSSDFTCTSGDPDPNNDNRTVQSCPQENPTTPNNDAACNTPVATTPGQYCQALICAHGSPSKWGLACTTDADCRVAGDGICAATPDGIADPGELAGLTLRILNSSTDSLGNPRSVPNLEVGIRALTPSVACLPKATTKKYNNCLGGHCNSGTNTCDVGDVGEACTPGPLGDDGCRATIATVGGSTPFCTHVGKLNFSIDPSDPGPGRSSAATFAEAAFALTAVGDNLEGMSPLQLFKLFVDLDIDHQFQMAAYCPNNPSAPPGTLCEDFDTERNGVGGYQFSRLPIAVTADPLRAEGDPNDDVLGFTMDTGPSPTGTDSRTCLKDVGRFATCSAPVAEENDWHLHAAGLTSAENTGYDPLNRTGIAAPDGGKAHLGLRSMHWGRHTDETNTLGDTNRYRQISAFVLDSQGNPSIPGVVVGPQSTGEFWHIISVPDDENAGNGFVPPGRGFGGAQIQVSLLGNNGNFERWQIVIPATNSYDSIIQGTISICEFDPGDDQTLGNNQTMCDNNPMWMDIGDVFGTDATCVVDTDGNDSAHFDCGDTTSRGPGFTENGSVGNGVWAKSVFSLQAFQGRTARVRWIGTEGGGWSFGISRSFLEPAPGGVAYEYYDGDDGWYIDDIVLTDLRAAAPFSIAPDNVTGLYTCKTAGITPLVGNTDNCGIINPAVAASSLYVLPTDALGRRVVTDGPGVTVRLDARGSVALDDPGTGGVEGECENGVLQCQWSEIDPNSGAEIDLIHPFTPQCELNVAPLKQTTYRVRIQCSSDKTSCGGGSTPLPSGHATRDILVGVYTGDIDLDVIGGGPSCAAATLKWKSISQSALFSGYDVYRRKSTDAPPVFNVAGNLNASCFNTPPVGGVPQPVNPTGIIGFTDVTLPDTECPASGVVFYYEVGSRPAALLGPAGLGTESLTSTSTTPVIPPALLRGYEAATRCP